jgi:hypothetical protein
MNGTTPLKFEEPRIGTLAQVLTSASVGLLALLALVISKGTLAYNRNQVRFHARLPKAATNTTIASTIYF